MTALGLIWLVLFLGGLTGLLWSLWRSETAPGPADERVGYAIIGLVCGALAVIGFIGGFIYAIVT